MVSLAQRIKSASRAFTKPNIYPDTVTSAINPETGKIEYSDILAPDEKVKGMKSATKYSGGGYSIYDTMSGLTARDGNITYSENGAAQTWGVMVGVQAGIRFYMDAIGLLTLQLLDEKGEVVYDDTMPTPTDANEFEGAGLIIAMKDFHTNHMHDYLSSVVFSDLLFAETYTYSASNRLGQNSALEWVNPLQIAPNINRGVIMDFRYSSDKGFYSLPVDDIAYRIYNRDPFNDLRGQSRVLSAIDAINIERNAKRAISGFFSNGMILGGVISPSGNDDYLSPPELDKMRREISNGNGGVAKAFSWVFTPVKMNVEAFQADDMNKHYEIVKSTRNEIMTALSVPKELVGDSEGVSYENAEPVMKNWLKVQGRAYADSQLRYLNDSLLSKFAPDAKVRFAYDFSQIDRREASLVHADLNSGIIHLGDAAKERGVEVDSDIDKAKIFMLNGVPYSQERLLAIASGEVVSTTTKPDGSSTTSGGENNAPVELSEVPTEQVFGYHIDSGIVTINEARAQIGLLPKADKEVDDLQALQAQFAVMATAAQAGIPAAISSLMVGLTIPSETPPPELETPETQAPTFADKHVHNHDLNVVKFEPNHETPLQELNAWQKFNRNNKVRKFVPIHLCGDMADIVTLGIKKTGGDPAAMLTVFDEVRKALALKAIQATRLGFEDDFDSMMTKARADNNFGRTQWSSGMRKVLKRFGRMAYTDGLTDGGVSGVDLSENDLDKIAELNTNNSRFVTNLGAKLFKDENGISDALAEQKAAQWFNGSINPFYQAGLLSADRNAMMEWVLGKTEEHCPDCKRLNGQRHRYKDWIRKIGSMGGIVGQNTDCEGYHCDCKGVKVKGKAKGSY